MGPPRAEHVAGEPQVDLSSAEYFDQTASVGRLNRPLRRNSVRLDPLASNSATDHSASVRPALTPRRDSFCCSSITSLNYRLRHGEIGLLTIFLLWRP